MIRIDNLQKEIGTRTLFKIDKLTIGDREKIGLIGNNGAGKTTFLKLLLGQDTDYSGYVEVKTKIDFLLNEEKELKASEGVYLKAGLDLRDRYSPGEQQKLKLTNLLLNVSSFLLIDEPTTHLDIKQKNKLAESLKNRYKGFIIISHDRDFINQTCDKIFELAHGELEVFNGDYSFYLEERVKRQKFVQREYAGYIAERKRLSGIAGDLKAQSSKVKTTPKRMGNSEARLHKMGGQGNKKKLDKQVKAVESRIGHLEVKEKPKAETLIELTVPEINRIHAKIVVKAEKLSKRFAKKIIFDNTKLEIENNSRIALLGDNGSGKTTLINMILNGEVWVHPNLKIGYYSQLGETLDPTQSILDHVLERSIYDQTMTRIVLARLGFKTDDVHKTVGVLSDGEKAKVKLATLMTSDFNFLMMDEPTNFLDIRAIEALEALLKGYDRPLLFVTHDVSFINNIADGLIIIEDRQITHFRGNLNDYKKRGRKSVNNSSSDDVLIDFRLASISSQLAMDISHDEKEALEAEYDRLLKQKNR